MLFETIRHFSLLLSLSALPSVRGADFQVAVGGPGVLQFHPSTVNVAAGDTVTFIFMQGNHTATQSTFESPCEMAPNGFDTGFVPVADSNTGGPFPAAQVFVEDTKPVWVYCQQANHCQQGMVFAINPGDQFPAFQAAAMGTTLASSGSAPTVTSLFPSLSSIPPSSPSSTTQSTPPITPNISSPSTLGPTPVPSTDHKVVVGGPNKLFFSPSNITAQIGDTVTFQFMQENHTVTQSSFQSPCSDLSHTSADGQVGFDSGFMPVADDATTFPAFTIKINDTAPVWAFCKQGNHCGQGMVFSVNAAESGSNSFAAFQARAKQQNGTGTSAGTRRFIIDDGAGIIVSVLAALICSLL